MSTQVTQGSVVSQYPFQPESAAPFALNNKPNKVTVVVPLGPGKTTAEVFFAQNEGGSHNVLLDNSSTEDPRPLLPRSELGRTSAQSQTLTGEPGDLLVFEFAVTNEEPVLYDWVAFVD